MRLSVVFISLLCVGGMTALQVSLCAAELTGEPLRFFESSVRPLLAENCYECHATRRPKAGLRLDSRQGMLEGGHTGPAIAPGDPAGSLILRAVSYRDAELQMPPDGQLSARQVAALTRWIRMGAPWPDGDTNARAVDQPFEITDQDRAHWAFQPVRRPQPPRVALDRLAAHPIDAFVIRLLQNKSLQQNESVGKHELIRRITFDLIGLPPTPEQIEEFLADGSPDAYEKVVDRLLASPHYGERWARHWLDVVRYAQTNGYERDEEKPYAWRYRDYVIRALNEDTPYDCFVMEQLAGDELDDVTRDSLIATGFYCLGVWDDDPPDRHVARYDYLDDIVQTTGATFMGLTIGCARCHDHMFDPIPQTDYYELLAFFHNIKHYGDRENPNPEKIFRTLPDGQYTLAVREHGSTPPKTHVFARGNPKSLDKEVEPRFLAVMDNRQPASLHPTGETSGLRRALAEWLVDENHPLTARVLVNRLWQHHFGRGIVTTPNDFGVRGLPPSHPQLLDWLAAELVHGDWSIKRMHRLVVTAGSYRLSSQSDNASAESFDSNNRLIWRQNLRRLEAEAIRDSILAVSGRLNRQLGGRGIFPRLSAQVLAGWNSPGRNWEVTSTAQRSRRSIYAFVKRSMRVPFLEIFDSANTTKPVGTRSLTTVAPQALMLLNGEFMHDQAGQFAERLVREAGRDQSQQIVRAYHLALGRKPNARERQIARSHLDEQARRFHGMHSRITFSPRVPASLDDRFHLQLLGEDLLAGPLREWNYFKGHWGDKHSDAQFVDIDRGPFALWDHLRFCDGDVQGRFKLHHASLLGSLILRGLPAGDVWHGYELMLDPLDRRLVLRRHHYDIVELATAKAPVQTSVWHHVRFSAEGPRLRAWLDGSARPLVDVIDPQPITRAGHFGVRTWGGSFSMETVQIQPSGPMLDGPAETIQSSEPEKPLDGWQYQGGHWSYARNGTFRVQTNGEASTVWNELSLGDGLIQCEVDLEKMEGSAGLLFRVASEEQGAPTLTAYNVNISKEGLKLRLHENGKFHQLASWKSKLEPRSHLLRVYLDGARIRVGIGESVQPRIDYMHENPLGPGRIGFLANHCQAGFRKLHLETDGRKRIVSLSQPVSAAPWPTAQRLFTPAGDVNDPRQAALKSLCLVLLNLNEFVYVD